MYLRLCAGYYATFPAEGKQKAQKNVNKVWNSLKKSSEDVSSAVQTKLEEWKSVELKRKAGYATQIWALKSMGLFNVEQKNFAHAGGILAEIWSKTVIDKYEVVADYISPEKAEYDEEQLIHKDWKWRENHVRESQYMLQIVKCEDRNCCSIPSSSYFNHKRPKNVWKFRALQARAAAYCLHIHKVGNLISPDEHMTFVKHKIHRSWN